LGSILASTRRRTGKRPPVLDARDVLVQPRRLLETLCESVEIPFSERMLSWPAGRRDTDGVWAKYWYEAVEKSTGFQPYRPKKERLPASLQPLLEECMPYYEKLHALRLQP